MNRRLGWISLVSFALSAACLLLGFSIAGRGWASERQRWWGFGNLGCDFVASHAPPGSASLAWDQGNALAIDLPGMVYYEPGPKAGAIVTGDADLVGHVRLSRDRLYLDTDSDCIPSDRLVIRLTGPAITNWNLDGSARLALSGIDQDAIDIRVRGSGSVVATGTVRQESLRLSGSGAGDLADLAAKSATVRVSGSGDADIAPQDVADTRISGSGSVRLHSHPTQIQSHVSGSGSLQEARPGSARARQGPSPWTLRH